VSRRPIACLALFAALLSGCAGRDYRPGAKPVTAHWPGKDSSYNLAPYPGEYVLLRAGESSPIEKRELPKDVAVGFEVLPDGRLTALAGAESFVLPEGDYRWHVVRVNHWQRARLAMRAVGDEVAPVVSAICVAGLIVLLVAGAMWVLTLLPPGSVHL
jgi:hypothetical protein